MDALGMEAGTHVANLDIEGKRCKRCRCALPALWTLARCTKCEVDRRVAAALATEERKARKKELLDRRLLTHDLLAPLPAVE